MSRAERKNGDLGTFVVQVQHNQNFSWQGRITWLENNETISFRSVSEMLRQMEGAIGPIGGEDGRSWKNASNPKEADNNEEEEHLGGGNCACDAALGFPGQYTGVLHGHSGG